MAGLSVIGSGVVSIPASNFVTANPGPGHVIIHSNPHMRVTPNNKVMVKVNSQTLRQQVSEGVIGIH